MSNRPKGPTLLAASPNLEDPIFNESVVAIVEHNRQGALGFILNRPKPTPLASVINQKSRAIPEYIPTWYGGPVGLDGGIIFADQNIAALPDECLNFHHPDIAISSGEKALNKLVDHAEWMSEIVKSQKTSGKSLQIDSLYPFRFMIGYAGWGPQQLENEIRQGSWIEIPVQPTIMFNSSWDQMWSQAIQSLGFQVSALAPQPQDFLH
jgi:putative transcriptional regulator